MEVVGPRSAHLPFLSRRPVLPPFGATLSVQDDPRLWEYLRGEFYALRRSVIAFRHLS